MKRFVAPNADHASLTAAFAPTAADVAAVFVDARQSAATTYYQRKFNGAAGGWVLHPEPEESELLMWRMTTTNLVRGDGDAVKCPPEFSKAAAQFKRAITWQCVRFVVPAEKKGTTVAGLTYVNGRWLLFPTPWEID